MKFFDSNMKFFLTVVLISQGIVFSSIYSMDKSSASLAIEAYKSREEKILELICKLNKLFLDVAEKDIKVSCSCYDFSFYKLEFLNKYRLHLDACSKKDDNYFTIELIRGEKKKYLFYDLVGGVVKPCRQEDEAEFEKYPGLGHAAQVMQVFANKRRSLFDLEKNKKSLENYNDVVVTCDT